MRVTQENNIEKICKQHFVALTVLAPRHLHRNAHKTTEPHRLAAGRAAAPRLVPAAHQAATRPIDASRTPGDVLLPPWAADRTPSWNHGEVMLDAWPHRPSPVFRIYTERSVVNPATSGGACAPARREKRIEPSLILPCRRVTTSWA